MTNSSVEQQDEVCLNSFLCYDLVCKMQIGWGKLHSSFPLITFQVTGLLCFKNQQEAGTKTQICESEFEQDKLGQSGSVSLFFCGGAALPPAVFPARSLQTFQWCMDVFKPFVSWIGQQSQSIIADVPWSWKQEFMCIVAFSLCHWAWGSPASHRRCFSWWQHHEPPPWSRESVLSGPHPSPHIDTHTSAHEDDSSSSQPSYNREQIWLFGQQ